MIWLSSSITRSFQPRTNGDRPSSLPTFLDWRRDRNGRIFVPVRTSNGVTLDFAEAAEFRRQHYAFLVGEQEFDTALSRIKSAGVAYYADFNRDGRGQINHLYGGRGFYFDDPDGHLMEIITRPYGPTPERWSGTQS